MNKIRRRLRVCISRQCSKCPVGKRWVPEDCEYALKHVLVVKEPEVTISARQSGKTTRVMKEAAKAAEAGYPVTVVAMNMQEAKRLQRMMLGTGVEIVSAPIGAFQRGSLLFSDEVAPHLMSDLVKSGHEFVMGEASV